jgi:hypothetical protein
LKTVDDDPPLGLVIQSETHARNRELFYEGVDESRLIGSFPNDITLKLRLNFEDLLLMHPVEIGAGSKFIVGNDIHWRNFSVIVLGEGLLFHFGNGLVHIASVQGTALARKFCPVPQYIPSRTISAQI